MREDRSNTGYRPDIYMLRTPAADTSASRGRAVKVRPRSLEERRARPYISDVRPRTNAAKAKISRTLPLAAEQQAAALKVIKPAPQVSPAKPKQQPSQVLKRQFARIPYLESLPAQEQDKQPRSKRYSKLQVSLVTMALTVFGLGMFANVQTVQTNKNAKAQVAALSKQSDDDSGSKPSESKPSGGSYVVAPNMPKYLKITKLGVNARVLPLGVTSQNQLKSPPNIYDAGWYTASAHPGDTAGSGAILIDGHVHGPTLPGVFAKLAKLVPGDMIQIVRGDNKAFAYSVVKVQNYDADTMDMSLGLTSAQPGQPGLNLITCGGKYDRRSGEYEQRTLVSAVQVP